MTPRTQKSSAGTLCVRLSAKEELLLARLAGKLGIRSRSDLVRLAIARLADVEQLAGKEAA